jgi:hypothetical protein
MVLELAPSSIRSLRRYGQTLPRRATGGKVENLNRQVRCTTTDNPSHLAVEIMFHLVSIYATNTTLRFYVEPG